MFKDLKSLMGLPTTRFIQLTIRLSTMCVLKTPQNLIRVNIVKETTRCIKYHSTHTGLKITVNLTYCNSFVCCVLSRMGSMGTVVRMH